MLISEEIAKLIKGKSVLVVDDEEGIRAVLCAVFQSCQAVTIEARSGNEAMVLVKENFIDLIISDIRMAEGDGMALLANVRSKNDRCPPFIFVTGASEYTEAMAIESDAQAVITKPFSTKNLIGIAANVMGSCDCPSVRLA